MAQPWPRSRHILGRVGAWSPFFELKSLWLGRARLARSQTTPPQLVHAQSAPQRLSKPVFIKNEVCSPPPTTQDMAQPWPRLRHILGRGGSWPHFH